MLIIMITADLVIYKFNNIFIEFLTLGLIKRTKLNSEIDERRRRSPAAVLNTSPDIINADSI